MPDITIEEIRDADVEKTVALWQRCGLTRPWNHPHEDLTFARSVDNATVLVARVAGALIGSVMVGHDGHRGNVYYLSVEPARQGAGIGRALMLAAEDWLRERGVWKLNLMIRAENAGVVAFYEALGYTSAEIRHMARWLDPERDPNCGQRGHG